MRRNAAGLTAELTRPEQQAGGQHAGQTRTFEYDALNRLSEVTEAGLTTRYTYDAGDLLRHTYDPEGRHTEATYDTLGRVTQMIQHMGDGEPTLVTAYLDYDGEGNARRVRDPLGQETTLAYDDLGRLTDATYPQRSGDVSEGLARLVSTHTEYDGGDYVTSVTETRAPFGAGATFEEVLEWDHDAFGRLTRHGQRGRDVTYTYNDDLRQMAQASSGGSTLYQYDELGRIDWAELDGDRVDVSYVTHEDLVSSVTNPNGTSVAFEYDAATRRLTGLEHARGGTAFLGYEYAYDHNGNRTLETVTEGASTERNVYTYDALDRMRLHRRETGVNPAPSAVQETRYEFELGGERGYNRRVEVVQDGGANEQARRVYDYDEANRLTELSETGTATRTVSYEHDANGNRLSRADSAEGGEHTLYRYTALDQLTEVLHGAPGAEVSRGQYEYDATGRRVRQRGTTRGDVETVYDGLSTLDEHDITGGGSGTPLAHYHYALGLARLDEGGGEERYYHLDGRGNTGALTAGSGGADAPGDLLTSYRLDPFGAVRSGSDPVNRQLYTGHETDTETGLIYMNARHYDPETGRFVTQDSWMGSGGDPGTQNRYAYALGNPATYWDPTGHAPACMQGGGDILCSGGVASEASEPQREGPRLADLEPTRPTELEGMTIVGGSSPSPGAPITPAVQPRRAPPSPRGTFSVISGPETPAERYNANESRADSRLIPGAPTSGLGASVANWASRARARAERSMAVTEHDYNEARASGDYLGAAHQVFLGALQETVMGGVATIGLLGEGVETGSMMVAHGIALAAGDDRTADHFAAIASARMSQHQKSGAAVVTAVSSGASVVGGALQGDLDDMDVIARGITNYGDKLASGDFRTVVTTVQVTVAVGTMVAGSATMATRGARMATEAVDATGDMAVSLSDDVAEVVARGADEVPSSVGEPLGGGTVGPHTPIRVRGDNVVEALLPSNGGTGPNRWQRSPGASPRASGTTRRGIVRNNPREWRRWRDLWDETGHETILSPRNRADIAAGRTPTVDDAWIEWFPGDEALRGEPIPIHHIDGSPINVPLPESRHLDAHMPGGFRNNPGGPGTSG